jgi:hypothetical protein
MNHGTKRGFTWNTLPSGASYPEMRAIYVPYRGNFEVGVENVDVLLLLDSPSPFTIELKANGMKEGQCIHFAQWGAARVTITNNDGELRVADGLVAATRARFSPITAIFTNALANEFLVMGDLAAAP